MAVIARIQPDHQVVAGGDTVEGLGHVDSRFG